MGNAAENVENTHMKETGRVGIPTAKVLNTAENVEKTRTREIRSVGILNATGTIRAMDQRALEDGMHESQACPFFKCSWSTRSLISEA